MEWKKWEIVLLSAIFWVVEAFFPHGLNFSQHTFVFKCKNIHPSYVVLDFVAEISEKFFNRKYLFTAMARWFSWLECCPVHQKGSGLILSKGTYLGCGLDPSRGVYRSSQWVFLSHFVVSPSPPHALKSIWKRVFIK